MFATVIVVLPSAFEGGQLCLTHGGVSTTIDIARNSATETTLLAWYTDVMHEVKPITSGYRLALSYNLIHTSPTLPPPALPNMDNAMQRLHKVLLKWNRDKYPDVDFPSPPFFAYFLTHRYTANNLLSGIKTLNGTDAHRVSHLMPIAERLGIVVGLASLEYNVSGGANDSGYGYNKRHRGCYYDDEEDEDDEDVPEMGEIENSSYTLSNLVDKDGNPLMGNGEKHELDASALIPRDPFDGANPDDEEYEGYQGNVSF